jgi:AcrR family transcriptional regulator
MARPITISDDQILDAARAMFTEKGPLATTAEIAERAGVSEGILFKRFGNKAGLHKAAMTPDIAGAWIRREMRAQAPLRTKKDLERFIRWQTTALRDVVPVVVMAWSFRSDASAGPASLGGPEPAPLVAINTLTELLETEMAAGHLTKRNARAIAQFMTGSVWYFVFFGLLVGSDATIDEDTFVKELSRLVFSDLKPPQEAAAKPDPRRPARAKA